MRIQKPSDEEIALAARGTGARRPAAAARQHRSRDAARRAGGDRASRMDAIPRITRAQSMDALSSQATVAGYKAVLLAATRCRKFFPMLTTAAGTIAAGARCSSSAPAWPACRRIATARRLGAVVEAFDTRPVVKEQVESLGAKFLEIDVGKSEADAGGYAKELSEEQHRREQELLANARRASPTSSSRPPRSRAAARRCSSPRRRSRR